MFRFNLILLICLLPLAHVRPQAAQAVPIYFEPGSFSKKQAHAFSIAANPASLVWYQTFTGGLYADNRFMLAGLKHFVFAAGGPFAHGGLGVQLNYVSAGAYNQSEIGIGYAKQLGQADLGLKLNYYSLSIPAYAKAAALIVDLGSLWHITDNLHAGMHLYNPLGSKIGKGAEYMGYVWKTGLEYEVSKQVLINAVFIKEEYKPVNISIGIHYEPAARCLLQAGIATATAETYAGIGLGWQHWRIRMYVSYHMQLRWSPGIVFMYIRPNKNK